MTDRGEKIVSLAREMLASNANIPNSPAVKSSISFKTMCLAVMLSSLTTGYTIHAADEWFRPANKYERVEIDALVFYASRQNGGTAEALRDELMSYLVLPDLSAMTARDYKLARTFLLDRIK